MKDSIQEDNNNLTAPPPDPLAEVQNLLKAAQGKEYIIRSYDDDCEEKSACILSTQLWLVVLSMFGEVGYLKKFLEKAAKHAWGFVIDYAAFKEACGALRLHISEDKGFGINDGIKWVDGRTTRQQMDLFTGAIFDFGLSDGDFVILDFQNGIVCDCDFCSSLPKTKRAKRRFRKAWDKRLNGS